MEILLKGKIWKTGNGYVLTVPKTLVEAGVFDVGQEITAEVQITEKRTETPVQRKNAVRGDSYPLISKNGADGQDLAYYSGYWHGHAFDLSLPQGMVRELQEELIQEQ